jgi:hypothetical protein
MKFQRHFAGILHARDEHAGARGRRPACGASISIPNNKGVVATAVGEELILATAVSEWPNGETSAWQDAPRGVRGVGELAEIRSK